jgi:ubiquinone/menaquinone biosynthesis C-methylase UbiE
MITSQEKDWLKVNKCPLCIDSKPYSLGYIERNTYKFGNTEIFFPQDKISLYKCESCKIVYKSYVPSPKFIGEVFEKELGNIWSEHYDFNAEINLINNLFQGNSFDLLDIGASNGQLLKAASETKGRRSALDIVQNNQLKTYLRGEFIEGFLDDQNLSWSQNQYDVVTLFDVVEHVYSPQQIFKNLSSFVKQEGYVLIETGNSESVWSKKFGIQNWWYVHLFEHHIFWDKVSLENIAKDYGFETIKFIEKKSKNIKNLNLRTKIKSIIKSNLYSLDPKIYTTILDTLNKSTIQPFSPFTKDHFLMILRKTKF